MSTPDELVPAESRKGFHVPVWLVVVLGVLVVGGGAFLVGRAVSHRRERVGFGGRFDGGHVGHPIFWIFVVGIVIALIVAAVVALVRHYSVPRGQSAMPTAPSSAEELLAQRFARGEIDEAEYRARRDALRG
jgi:putative membrane protein